MKRCLTEVVLMRAREAGSRRRTAEKPIALRLLKDPKKLRLVSFACSKDD